MASRAKIVFFPKLVTSNYPMEKVLLIEKYSGWNISTDNYISNGYIYTDVKPTIAEINANYWVKFRPIVGYKFQSVHKTNYDGSLNSGEFEISNDGSVIIYPWNNGTATEIKNYLFFDVIENSETTFTVTQTLENCTSNNIGEYVAGNEVKIDLTCNTNYIFDTIPVLTMGSETLKFIVSDDKTTATITFTINDNTSIVASATKPQHKLVTELQNCTCNYSGTIPHGEVNIIIKANDGYKLNGVVNVKNVITHGYNNFTDGDTICNIPFDVRFDGAVYIQAQAIKKTEQISTFTNLYRVTNDTLSKLAKVRFRDSGSNIVDYGTFINNLIKIPFALPDDMIADIGDIQLGNYDSNVKADVLQTYIYSVNIGKITIPEKYGNIYDYKETNCILHLPCSENMVIPTEYVINHTLTIEYKLDLYSGNCTVNIISDFTNEIVDSKTFNIGIQIPFMQEQNNSVVSTLKNIIDNGVKTAFVEVVRNIPYNVNSVFGNETIDYGTLENYVGFIKVSDILLNITATNDEKNQIEMLLKNGVYINENI